MNSKAKDMTDHWLEAVKLSNQYRWQKALGASHKRLHNIDRQMKYHLNKMMQKRNRFEKKVKVSL